MANDYNLDRFLNAQKPVYRKALQEVKNGRKLGHWMWYIFPQYKGLGYSETSKFYSLNSKEEATAYLKNDILRSRLIEICTALLKLKNENPLDIFGYTDSLKLNSSMTLFSTLENTNPVFQQVLNKYYNGKKDELTLKLIK